MKKENSTINLEKKLSFSSMLDAVTEAVKLANVKVVYNYPGGPATMFVEAIKEGLPEVDVQDYLPNEFVATAKAFGSSVAGAERSLVIFKDVGTNVACDHIYCLNHIGVNRGLVFIVGDDPSAWGSQNEEDSRGIYFNAGLPILEPYDPYSAYYSILIAFELSEIVRLPVFIRTTRKGIKSNFNPEKNDMSLIHIPFQTSLVDIPFDAKNKWLSIFASVEEDRKELFQKQQTLAKYYEKLGVNVIKNKSKLGVIACGYPAYQLEEENLVADLSLLKLVTTFPLPEDTILNFVKEKERVLIIEQGEPLLEMLIRDLAYREGLRVPILGKNDGFVQRIGEFRDDDLKISIDALKADKQPPFFPEHKVIAKAGAFEKTSSFLEMLDCVKEAVKIVGCRPLYCGDAGQTSKIPETAGYEDLLHMETTMGCVISYLSGGVESYKRLNQKVPFKGIAYVGDSDFFHSALPGICEVASKDHPILMLIVDNHGAISTGGQPHLGMKVNESKLPVKQLSIKKILEALEISFIEEARVQDKKDLTEKLIRGLKYDRFAVLIVHLDR